MAPKKNRDVIYPELGVPDPSAFLNELEAMLRESTQWKLVPNQADFRAIVAEYRGHGFQGSNLAVCACMDETRSEEHHPHRIMFAIVADSWGDDFRMASRQQLIEAFQLYRGYVRTSTRHLRIPCRIDYPRAELPYKLPPGAQRMLDAFCGLANRSCLHPNDWERFYWFVRFCHAHSIKLGSGRLSMEMQRRGMPDGLTRKLADHYAFGRSLLKGEYCGLE